jgi:hypothetical protein
LQAIFWDFMLEAQQTACRGQTPLAGTDPSPYAVINGDLYAVRIVRAYLPLHSPRAAID